MISMECSMTFGSTTICFLFLRLWASMIRAQQLQTYPSPFNPSTMIRFSIPAKMFRISGTLEVFDILGQKVETLMTGEFEQGVHTVVWDGGRWPSGVYYAR